MRQKAGLNFINNIKKQCCFKCRCNNMCYYLSVVLVSSETRKNIIVHARMCETNRPAAVELFNDKGPQSSHALKYYHYYHYRFYGK